MPGFGPAASKQNAEAMKRIIQFTMLALTLAIAMPSCMLDGGESFDTEKGLIRKEVTLNDVRDFTSGNVQEVASSDYTVRSNDRILVVTTATDTANVSVPTLPSYEQTLWLYIDYTADNPVYLSGGIVDTVISDVTRLYYFSYADSTWHVLPR